MSSIGGASDMGRVGSEGCMISSDSACIVGYVVSVGIVGSTCCIDATGIVGNAYNKKDCERFRLSLLNK